MNNMDEQPAMMGDRAEQKPFDIEITISTLETIAEGLEAQAREYRETASSLSRQQAARLVDVG
jgi:hypothetical protein